MAAALGAMGAAALLGSGGATAASGDPGSATVTIVGKSDKQLAFEVSGPVQRRSDLEVVNKTDPRKVGPHTFTLIKKRFLPRTKDDFKAFFRPGGIGLKVAKAHRVDFESGEVGRPLVDPGRPGWDRAFSRKSRGDSWFTETKNESYNARTTPGNKDKLFFVCIVHPGMQGKIKVAG